MKRVKTIIADDGQTKATVKIEINDYGGKLVRYELDSMVEQLASAIMKQIPDTQYLGVRLSELVVK